MELSPRDDVRVNPKILGFQYLVNRVAANRCEKQETHMKKIILIIVQAIFILGCSNQNSLEKKIITKTNECWVVYSQVYPNYTFWSFNKDMTADNLERNENGHFKNFNVDDDLVIGPQKWNISSDSILTWDIHKYDIVNVNENIIVIMSVNKETKKQDHLFLIKENKMTLRKGAYYYEQKRLKNQEKYKSE